jgi:hypothetical protein
LVAQQAAGSQYVGFLWLTSVTPYIGRAVKDSKRHKEKFAETGPDVGWETG